MKMSSSKNSLLLVRHRMLFAPGAYDVLSSDELVSGWCCSRDQTGAVVPKVTVTIVGNEDGIARTAVTQETAPIALKRLVQRVTRLR